MELAWYTYFSWWVFIWFLLFKMDITRLSPYLMYCGILGFIFLKIVRDIVYFTFYDKKKVKKYDMICTWILYVLLIDIIPFFCLDRQIDKESIFFTLFLALAYCLVMNIWKLDVIEHYKVINYKVISDKYTPSSFFKEVFVL